MPEPERSSVPLAPRMILGLVAATILPGMAAVADGKDYVDPKYAFSIGVPKPWAEAPLASYSVPGTARAAWSGPAGSSIVAFVQEPPEEAISPRFLVDASAALMKKEGCTIKAAEVREVNGKKAMWLVLTSKGAGAAPDGKGDGDIAYHSVAVPREKDIVVVLLTCPAADYEGRRPSFEQAIKALKVQGAQTPEQAGAK